MLAQEGHQEGCEFLARQRYSNRRLYLGSTVNNEVCTVVDCIVLLTLNISRGVAVVGSGGVFLCDWLQQKMSWLT